MFKKKVYSKYKITATELTTKKGWISPSGVKVPLAGEDIEHSDLATKLLKKNYPAWNWENEDRLKEDEDSSVYSSDALASKGWVREVENGIYLVWRMTKSVKDTLIELISKLPKSTRIEIEETKGRGFQGTVEGFLNLG